MAGPDIKQRLSVLTRDREFHKYYDLNKPDLLYNDETARSSHDVALTAFAQLGALRLNVKRCMISLFDRSNQYIIAEATQTLSLQDDSVHEEGDGLWLGTCVIPSDSGICRLVVNPMSNVMNPTSINGEDGAPCVIPDLSEDDRFKDKPFVVCAPFSRFYAGVPIRTQEGIAIGSYCVLDDLPHENLSEASLQFMKDVAATIMSHLELTRAREQNRRGERMLEGLASFVEGRATIRDWEVGNEVKSLDDSHRSPSLGTLKPLKEGQLVNLEEKLQQDTTSSLGESADISTPGPFEKPKQLPSFHTRPSHNSTLTSVSSQRGMASVISSPGSPSNSDSSRLPTSPSISKDKNRTSDLRNEMPSKNLQHIFSRAANIIRESIEVEGVIFFDASVTSFGGLVDSDDVTDHSDTNDSTYTISSGDEGKNHFPGVNRNTTRRYTKDITKKKSPILGISTSEMSSITSDFGDFDIEEHFVLEQFLAGLLERHPNGKLFNFDDDGTMYSGSSSEGGSISSKSIAISDSSDTLKVSPVKSRRKSAKRFSTQIEADTIIRTFPGARCVAMMPLWDSHRERWLAGAMVWTKTPDRILTAERELSYLAAFSNSIMAEVTQLDAMIADKAKSDLLGSISHELRSPLHGIMGGVEIIEDFVQNPVQLDILRTVETCARTLLDTVDHLLDYSKINNLMQSSQSIRKTPRSIRQTAADNMNPNLAGNIARFRISVNLDILIEDVIGTVSVGYDSQRLGTAELGNKNRNISLTDHSNSLDIMYTIDRFGDGQPPCIPKNQGQRNVVVILNIDRNVKWFYYTQAGAWRRIVMNLFSNSLKYTDLGFIKVSLHAEQLPPVGNEERSNVILTIEDSGRGMSKRYLQDRLYKPFAQENRLDPGTGLGLSIVRQIISSLGGKIDLKSIKGVGTNIRVSIPLIHASPMQGNPGESDLPDFLMIRKQAEGLPVCLVVPGIQDLSPLKDINTNDAVHFTNMMPFVKESLSKICKDWFGMDMHYTPVNAIGSFAVYLVFETPSNYPDLRSGKFLDSIPNRASIITNDTIPLVIVLCRSTQSAYSLASSKISQIGSNNEQIIEYISQPCAPRKLARALSLCFERLAKISDRSDNKTRDEYPTVPILINDNQAIKIMEAQTTSEHVEKGTVSIKENLHPDTQSTRNLNQIQPTSQGIKGREPFLLVDDNPINLKILIAYMKKNNLSYASAMDGKEALEAYKNATLKYKTIFMDISMPVMDGLESTRAIRTFEQEQKMKPANIIVLTGVVSASVEQEALASGASLYLTKPLRLKELNSILMQED